MRGRFAAGTKRERDAIFPETDEGRFLRRRKSARRYDDGPLEKLVGQRVRCGGSVAGHTMIAERIEPLS